MVRSGVGLSAGLFYGVEQQFLQLVVEGVDIVWVEFHFDRQVVGAVFQLLGEVGIVDQAHGVFLRGDEELALPLHLVEASQQAVEVAAGEVVMVGVLLYLYLGVEAAQITHEWFGVGDA